MEQTKVKEQSADQLDGGNSMPAIASPLNSRSGVALSPQTGVKMSSCGCPSGKCTCGAAADQYPDDDGMMAYSPVYAPGRVDPRIPSLSLEKEIAQAIGRTETHGLTDRETLYKVLSKPENRYLVRQMCWVLSIGGMETYILRPHDAADFSLLVEAINPAIDPMNHIDVVIGARGPIAPPEMCNGLMVPIAMFDQIYSFDREAFIQAVPQPDRIPPAKESEFRKAVREVFDRIMQMADNAGATDEHRALNYLALRYPEIYATTAEHHMQNFALTAIDINPSPLSGVRKIVEAIFSYTNRRTDFTEKFFVRVDVTEEFPFLVTKLSHYYDR